MMTLDDLQREVRTHNDSLNTFVYERKRFTYVTDAGAEMSIDSVCSVYDSSGEVVAFLTGFEAAPLRAAKTVTVWYNGCNYPADIKKRRNGDIDLSFTPDRA